MKPPTQLSYTRKDIQIYLHFIMPKYVSFIKHDIMTYSSLRTSWLIIVIDKKQLNIYLILGILVLEME
jgi:hypothetical protein